MYTEKMDKISFWLYLSVTVWNSCLVLSVLIFCVVLVHCLKKKNGDRECYNYTDLGTELNGACFALLSVLLLAAVIPLFSALNTL